MIRKLLQNFALNFAIQKNYSAVFFTFLFLFLLSGNLNAQCTISGSSINSSALVCGTAPLTACNGILNIGDGITPLTIVMNADLDLTCLGTVQLIVNKATLDFSTANKRLYLATGSSISFVNGGTLNPPGGNGGGCTGNDRVYIGSVLLATCQGGAGILGFDDLISLGGTGHVSSNSPVCAGNNIALSVIPPPNGTFTYTWTGPNGFTSTSQNPTPFTATTSPVTAGIYTVSITRISDGMTFSLTTTVVVNVTSNTVGPASSSPTVCLNTAMTIITHATTGATGIGVTTGLPTGVSASWMSNTITISGTPTTSGTFNYNVPLTGGCGSVNAIGTITVMPTNTAGIASSTPTVCIDALSPNITHTTTGATGIGTATGLPAGVTAAWASNLITISGTPTASGNFNYTIPLTGGCGIVNATGAITVNSKPNAPTFNLSNVTLECNQTVGTETWTAIPNILNYLFDVSSDSFANYIAQNESVDASATSYNVNLNPGTTYYVRAKSVNSCGTSVDYSPVVTITVNSLPPAPSATATSQPTCTVSTGTITVTSPTGMNYSIDGSDYTNSTGIFNNVPVGSYTVTARNVSGCTSSGSVPIAINASVINTWDGTKWSKTGDTTPPIINDAVVFNADFPPITTQLNACSCQINSGANVVVGVPGGVNADAILKIENGLNVAVGGTLTFENNASLVQVNDNAVNSGKIIYKRITAPMKNFDFTYWCSPVKDQVLNVLSPNTLFDKYYSFNNGGWVVEAGTNMMNPPGKGFIIRVPKPGVVYPNGEFWNTATYAQPVQFVGVPNNTIPPIPAQGAGLDNLIGNPYPSAIDADSFINANAGVIGGALNFWTHNTAITQSGAFYVYDPNDYASYTLAGGIAATTGGEIPSGKIAAGQSFFVISNNTNNFVFNNSMRNTAKVLTSGSNSQFFRMSQTKKMAPTEKNRVWLNLTNSDGVFKQLLVGYITGATNEIDNLYDGISLGGNMYADFYSINNGKNFAIQGRALPFDETDQIPLGYRTTIQGAFAISIGKTDGVLADQSVFIEDKVTGAIANLKNGPYTFSTATGVFNNRFILRFVASNTSKIASKIVSGEVDNSVLVSVKNKQISINSHDEIIDKVMVYDLKTSLLYKNENLNTNEFTIPNFNPKDQFLIVQVLLKNGKWVTKEIVF